MTKIESKAEAEKIIEMFMEARDYHGRKILKPTAYQCAIIHVKGILKYITRLNNTLKLEGILLSKKGWELILTELKRM